MRFLRFIGFSGVRAWQGFWRNAMMSLATTATVVLMLVLLSGLFIVISGLNSGLEFIESKVGVTADGWRAGQADLTQPQLDALIAYTRSLPGVEDGELRQPGDGHAAPQGGLRAARPGARPGRDQARTSSSTRASRSPSPTRPTRSRSPTRSADRAEVVQITTKQAAVDKLIGIINVIRTVGMVAIALVGADGPVHDREHHPDRGLRPGRRDRDHAPGRVPATASSAGRSSSRGSSADCMGALVAIGLVAIVWDPIQPVLSTSSRCRWPLEPGSWPSLSALLLAVGLGVGAIGSWISVRSYLTTAHSAPHGGSPGRPTPSSPCRKSSIRPGNRPRTENDVDSARPSP